MIEEREKREEEIMSKDLKATVEAFVKKFNGRYWDQAADLLDDDAVLSKVDDIKPPIVGREEVRRYMKKNCEDDRPKFIWPPQQIHPHKVGSYAVVNGLAKYKDKEADKDTHKLRYLFVLRKDKKTGNWLFLLLYGKLV